MADAIGTFLFVSLKGEIGASKPINQDISRQGVTGSAWRILPNKGEDTTLIGMALFASNSLAAGAAANYASYSSTLQTITIFNLGTFTNYFVVDVHVQDIPKLVSTSAGLEWLVMSTWRVRATQ